MDGTHRSIPNADLKKAIRKTESMLMIGGKLKSRTLADGRIRRDLVQKIKRWAKWWETRGGGTVVLRMVIATSATPNILELNNTMRNARKPISQED